MSINNYLSRNPKDCDIESPQEGVEAWYYEEKEGLIVIVHSGVEFIHVRISWRSLLSSIGRYLKFKGRKIVEEETATK